MTIKKGEQWGTSSAPPPGLVVADSDADLATLVAREPLGSYGVRAGDLHHSLGAPPQRPEMQRLPLDALMVSIDDDNVLAVAHVVARDGWWSGPIVVVANCGYVNSLNVAPRAHPNDGRFDVIEVDPAMSVRQRLQARRRVRSGTHVPHPDLSTRTGESAEWQFDEPLTVHVDGVRRRRCTRLAVTISPDHFAIFM